MKNYQPEILGTLIGLALLNLWYLSGVAVEEQTLPIQYDFFMRAVITLVSAGTGAYFAFSFNNRIEDQKSAKQLIVRIGKDVAILNKSLFNLSREINSIGNMKIRINQFDREIDLAFNMSVEKNFDSNVSIDIDELTLILTDSLPILQQLDNEQVGFYKTVESFNVRSDFFLNRLQPEMLEKGLLDRKATLEEIKEKLSAGIFQGAFTSASALKSNIYITEKGLIEAFKNLRNACVELYPEHKFMNIEFDRSVIDNQVKKSMRFSDQEYIFKTVSYSLNLS
ncbi:hypothetical protein GCM10007978_19740 [Shewanella hanedai]|uniref:Uncharacterized protein n=1 Tax=Shewanella hanedai TaxID=25 RepID=A0A553JME9_SHEHA|nr:hypothetical protein [Shewanella hanedai]TRY13570.1 hypothetical protein FN961_15145 [Shewanella hanedai]GGI82012.1 hypothetical protein GCM10007978_19740 [Shewanella hanedai]